MKVLVTGGAGYIGTHTCIELLNNGYEIIVMDNYSNSSPDALRVVEKLTNKTFPIYECDMLDYDGFETVFKENKIDAVIHFAGLKVLGESVQHPLAYYDNNVVGTVRLLEAMTQCKVKTLVFSSSAAVYGPPLFLPVTEDHPLSTGNPYGQTKLVIEGMLNALFRSDPIWRISLLRYFNPVGAHPSGLIGEDPQGIPNNLLPFVAQVAAGRREFLNVWGNDYATPDGTGVRDYIHVVDLAQGHLKALERLQHQRECRAINLGTGVGYSVLDMVRAFEQASGKPVPYQVQARREDDVASCYADPSRALALLGWRAERELETMCADAWRWQSHNPDGYLSS